MIAEQPAGFDPMVGTIPPLTGIKSGAGSFMAYGLETEKGVMPSQLTRFLAWTGNTMGAAVDAIRADAATGDRWTEAVVDYGKGKISGTITHPLWSGQGALFFLAALGKEVWYAPLTADTTNAVATTTNGLTTLTVANAGAQTYVKGAFIQYGTAPFTECVQICDITGNGAAGTQLQIKQLRPTTSTASGQPVHQLGQHKFTIPTAIDTFMTPPTLTVEDNFGHQFAWRMAGVQNAKIDVRGQRELVDVTHTLIATEVPIPLDINTFTPYTPTQNERSEWRRPYTIRDGYVVTSIDQGGGRFLQRGKGLEEFNITFDNRNSDHDFWDENPLKDNFPENIQGRLTYRLTAQAGRWDMWDDYLMNRDSPPFPFFLTCARNFSGSAGSPAYHAFGFYMPEVKVMEAPPTHSLNTLLTQNVACDILKPDDGSDPIACFVVNDDVGAYVAG